ncbi:MAG: PSD1 and planctomycete cytochrome C domain-containing protein [Pirellulaceae bacterium]
MRIFSLVVCLLLVIASRLGAETVDAKAVDFVRDIQPILKNRCYECHSEDLQRSGLRLDIKSEAFKGGELYGESILPGKPEESPIYQFLADEGADLSMPPEGDPLSAAEVELIHRWIAQGANWPDGVDTAVLEDPRDHWSLKPVAEVEPPSVKDEAWPREPLDNFILARLEQEGLSPSPEADRVAWLRRVTFDLTGLPPTPEEVAAFEADERPDAFEQVVERLLSSPRYGERWAQHWLDVVRYADTHGFEVNTERPNAWPYRDYVIKAFNDDLPYDQFIREQIAGDAMGVDPATGFLVTASVLLPGQIGKDEPSKRLARQDSLDEIVANVGQSFLGLSISCARCHNHKFDPISQRDYYEMQAFFAGVEYGDRDFQMGDPAEREQQAKVLRQQIAKIDEQLTRHVPLASSGAVRPMVNARENVDRFEPVKTAKLRFTIRKTNLYEPCIDELEIYNTAGENLALASSGAKITSSGDNVSRNRHELRLVNNGRYGNSSTWMADKTEGAHLVVELPEPTEIERVVWGRDREGKFDDRLAIDYQIEVEDANGDWQLVAQADDRKPYDKGNKQIAPYANESLSAEQAAEVAGLNKKKTSLEKQLRVAAQPAQVFAGRFREPDEIRVLGRGSPEMPKEKVTPAVLSVLDDLTLPADADEQDRRLAVADWIASPENPLTARVMVNRIWQGHFGRGLVGTPNDFGRNGVAPTHGKLLDWLSARFVESGWSIKAMHRRIVLSATYRQASRHNPAAAELDADAELLWRYPLQRMDGEAIRDSILAINGKLNLEMGGPGYSLFNQRGGLSGFTPIETFDENGLRRMIYAHKVRRERDAIFGAFDCPDGGQSAPQRRESTTSIQALNLLNSRFVIDQSAALAERVIADVGPDPAEQIAAVYRMTLNRAPRPDEASDALPTVEQHGLAPLCRALLNSNEFLFIP